MTKIFSDKKYNNCNAPQESWSELEPGLEYVYGTYSLGNFRDFYFVFSALPFLELKLSPRSCSEIFTLLFRFFMVQFV